MKEVKCSIVLLLIIALAVLLVSGCGNKCPETCDDGNACTTDYCTKETNNLCVHDLITDCHVGNKKCEPELGETKCNAPADCGKCGITTFNITSSYLEPWCDEVDRCVLAVKQSEEITPQPFSKILSLSGFKVSFKATFNQIFNIDEDLIVFEIELTDISTNTIEPQVSKIQYIATINRKEIILGETNVEKIMFDIGDKATDEMMISYEYPGQEFELKTSKLKVFYEYKYRTAGRDDEIKRGSVDYSIVSPLIFVNPTKIVECVPAGCDDGNPATLDLCIEGTAFCKHERVPNRCQNYKCESAAGENKCTCPQDCGKCARSYGDYLEFACSDGECMSQIRTNVLTKTFASEKSTTYFTFNTESSMNQPFKIDSITTTKSDKIEITARLTDDHADLVSGPKFNMIEVFGQNQELLGTEVLTSNNALGNVGSYVSFEVPLSFIMEELEEERTISPKLYYEYTYKHEYWDGGQKKTENILDRDSFSYSLSKIDFVSPDK